MDAITTALSEVEKSAKKMVDFSQGYLRSVNILVRLAKAEYDKASATAVMDDESIMFGAELAKVFADGSKARLIKYTNKEAWTKAYYDSAVQCYDNAKEYKTWWDNMRITLKPGVSVSWEDLQQGFRDSIGGNNKNTLRKRKHKKRKHKNRTARG